MYGHGWVVGRGGGSLGEEPPVAQQREDCSHWGTVLSEVYIASELSERKTPLSGTNGFNGKIRDIDTQSSFVGAKISHKK